MSKKVSFDFVLRPTRPPVVFETLNHELGIEKLIEQYQNSLPQLVMVKRGYCGETDSDTIGMGQVLRIHGVYSERRVIAKVKTDLNHFFGCGDVMISVPTNCPIPMCCIKKDGSLKPAKPLKTILEECILPVTVQLISDIRNDVQFKGMTVRLARDVRLTLQKEYDEKYIFGNPVSGGELFQNDLSFPSCVSAITLSVITGIQSPNEEQWQPMLESMNHTVKEYIKFDGKICTSEILDCSSPDFNIKRLKDDRRKKPRRRHSLYTFFSKVKRKKRMSSTLDEYVYEDIIDTEDTKAKSQSSCLDSLQPGKRNSTIPVSQSHSFSFFKRPNMRKKNPDHVDSTVIESASSKNTDAVPSTKKTERRGDMVGGAKPSGQINCLDSLQQGKRKSTIPVSQRHSFSFFKMPNMRKKNPDHVYSTVIESASSKNTDAVPSTKKTERQGGMVGDVKPSGHEVKLQDVVRPPDIKIVKPVNSSST